MRRLIRPLAETLTLQRLGIDEQLRRTLSSTDPVESMIETGRRTSRNVKRWQNGDMCLRWTAAGMLEAERQFRRSSATSTWRSSRSPSSFASPPSAPPSPLPPPRQSLPLRSQPSADHRTATTNFHGDRDILSASALGHVVVGLRRRLGMSSGTAPSSLMRRGPSGESSSPPRSCDQFVTKL